VRWVKARLGLVELKIRFAKSKRTCRRPDRFQKAQAPRLEESGGPKLKKLELRDRSQGQGYAALLPRRAEIIERACRASPKTTLPRSSLPGMP